MKVQVGPLAINRSEDPADELVADDVEGGHMVLSFCDAAVIVELHLLAALDGRSGCATEQSFRTLVSHGTHLALPGNARSGAMIERSDSSIACILPPVLEESKVLGGDEHVERRLRPDPFHRGGQFEVLLQRWFRSDQVKDILVQLVNVLGEHSHGLL